MRWVIHFVDKQGGYVYEGITQSLRIFRTKPSADSYAKLSFGPFKITGPGHMNLGAYHRRYEVIRHRNAQN